MTILEDIQNSTVDAKSGLSMSQHLLRELNLQQTYNIMPTK
jgi:hypothetical protein